jgi:Spy/CpxP family protein refolding chaperone
MAIRFALFVKFKEISTISKPKNNAELPKLHARTVQQEQPVETPKQRAKVPQKEAGKPEHDAC